jgi:predicted nucleotide-binding protein (sugar kinase/HSP70/actin superfamily)
MPSSGVSDGVQAAVQAKFPESIFLPVETTGDGAINVYSRVQMMLFKARQKARTEFEKALAETGQTEEDFKKRLGRSRRYRSVFARPAHRVAGNAANLVYALG